MKDIIITNLDVDFSSSYIFREGLFSAFCGLLGILPTLEKYKLKPHIIPKIKYYSTCEYNFNMIPYYIELNYIPEPIETILNTEFYNDFIDEFKKGLFYEVGNKIILDYQTLYSKVSGNDRYSENPSFEEANSLFFKYYKFPKKIMNAVNSFVNNNFKKNMLGLHYRGSDKITDYQQNPRILSKDEYFLIIEDYINNNNIHDVFLATDSITIIPYIIKLQEKYNLNIIIQDCTRFADGQIPFKNTGKDPIMLGTECLIDSILLSKCDALLLTNSALSAWSKIFNYRLPTYKISHFPFNWFPLGYIEYYKSENQIIQKILDNNQK
jgi:hypothetical protein